MIAIDTNIVVRAIVDDDVAQVARVRNLLARDEIFVSTTVLLETEWVLRGLYALARDTVADAIEKFCGLDTVVVHDAGQLQRALSAYRGGADFADIIHLLGCETAAVSQFATFDARLRKGLRNLSPDVAIISP